MVQAYLRTRRGTSALAKSVLPAMNALFAALVLAFSAQAEKPSDIRITKEGEPGTPMLVRGVVLDQQNKPIPGVRIYVYQTDASGQYNRPGADGHRLSGTLWTSKEGMFSFRTIRPGLYPGTRRGEHFHLELSGGGIRDHRARIDFYEDRDPKLVVTVGREGGPSYRETRFAWRPHPEIDGQLLKIELRVTR
jgi:protocatechuate 3,4-dioxygenase beta subunit